MKTLQEIFEENNKTLYYKKDLSMIKNAWLKNIREYTCQSVDDMYFLGMAKMAVCLLNQVNNDLFLNHCCHKGRQFDVEIADNKARDLAELFRYDLISYSEILPILDIYSKSEKFYFLVRLIYPSFVFEENHVVLDNDLSLYRLKIKQAIEYLNNQIYIPSLIW